MKGLALCLSMFFVLNATWGQVFVEKQTRHRFAQLTLGIDYQTNFGGQTQFLNAAGQLESFELQSTHKGRFLIGGTHFWGHADFYIAIPLFDPSYESNEQNILHTSGVETGFKYFPWKIKKRKIRPYLGFTIAPFRFLQDDERLTYPAGSEKTYTRLPLTSGLTFNHGSHLLELGLLYNYDNKIDYHISRTEEVTIETPPLLVSFSYRYMLETTLSAEPSWESGRTAIVTQQLAEKGVLNNFFIGLGLSSAWWLTQSAYNKAERPYLSTNGINIMGDFSVGYYWHRPDLDVSVNYRGYEGRQEAYGAVQKANRQSVGLEVKKYLMDYHGFVPFVGPIVSFEQLGFKEDFEGQPTLDVHKNKLGYGLVFGWDIRPNRIQSFLLRTNLRYYPNLKLEVGENQTVAFDNMEFNFIQLILFPDRIF